MNIGFIGAGNVAQLHLQNLSKMKGVKISAICDTAPERAAKVAALYEANPYKDYQQMLRAEQLDACYVCVIPGAHGNIEIEVAEAKIPLYVETPVHLNLTTCQKVIDTLEKHNTINSVGYQWRYLPSAQSAKRFIDKHQISLIEGSHFCGFPGAPWWRQMALSGGQLVEQATHMVDLARYFGGEVHTVFAAGSVGAMSEIHNYDIYDTSITTLMFDSGAIGHITTGCVADKSSAAQVSLVAKGRDWTARVGDGVCLSDKKTKKEVAESLELVDELANSDKAFVQAVRTGDMSRILSPYKSGAQTLAITLAANTSMKTGKPASVRRFV